MDEQYFVVLQTLDTKHKPQTVYPEVHYVFEDDAFAPEIDALEHQAGDVSVIIDLDETGTQILNCQSISPDWQVLSASLDPQNLDISRRTSPANHNSNLLRIQGITPQFAPEARESGSDASAQASYCQSLIEEVRQRQQELEVAVASFTQKERQLSPI